MGALLFIYWIRCWLSEWLGIGCVMKHIWVIVWLCIGSCIGYVLAKYWLALGNEWAMHW